MYSKGQGVHQDYKEAVLWYRKAAEQGHSGAQYNLGIMYDEGQGVPQDYKEAVKWTRLAAEQGHSGAQYHLGNNYRKGQGVPQDYKEAFKWTRLAAEQGLPQAQFRLGVMYSKGQGVHQDYKEAVKWYRKVAVAIVEEQSKNKGVLLTLAIIGLILIVFLRWVYRLIRKIILGRVHKEQEREKEQVHREQERQCCREKERQEPDQSRKKREKPKNSNEKKRSYEEILGLSSGWTKSDLKSAYRNKCQQTHPDKWKDFPEDIAQRLEEEYKEVQEAYKYLSKK